MYLSRYKHKAGCAEVDRKGKYSAVSDLGEGGKHHCG